LNKFGSTATDSPSSHISTKRRGVEKS